MSVWSKLRGLLSRRKHEAEMAEEMRLHLEHRAQEAADAGLNADEARRAALRKFGGLEQAKERCRDQIRFMWFEQFLQDARFAWRGLRKHPGFTSVAVLTLALGIGANTALFTFFNALALRQLPVSAPERLVHVQSTGGDENFSYPAFERFRDGTRAVELAVSRRGAPRMEMVAIGFGAGEIEPVRGELVSGNFFNVLGAQAALGRVFGAEDNRVDQPQPVVVLSHAFWQRRFGGDPGVLGRTLRLENVVFTIIGVMPAAFTGFELGVKPDLWWPLPMFPQVESDAGLGRLRDEGWEWALVIGRLADGVSREQVQAELQTIFARDRRTFADARPKWTDKQRRDYLARAIELRPAGNGHTSLRNHFARPLAILAIVVGTVLVIACANLAGLLLARGAARQRELAVRAALGAGRGRLVRQLLTESLLLAGLGGVAGALLGQWGVMLLVRYLPPYWQGVITLRLDWPVLGFAFGISLLTGALFGLLPALKLGGGTAPTGSRATAAVGRSRLNQALVIGQIALSVALLAGAGLVVRSLLNLRATDLGFQPEKLVGFALEFGRSYTPAQRTEVHRRVLEALQAQPEVRGATLSSAGLFSGEYFGIRVSPEGYTPQPDENMRALAVVVGPQFFSTMGVPLRAGREFTLADERSNPTPTVPRVAIIGEAFARRFFGRENPIGRTVQFGAAKDRPPLEIIGVAADVKYRTIREQPEMEIYVPYFGGLQGMPMTVRVATRTEPKALAGNIRALVKQIDPGIAVSELRAMEDVVDEVLMRERVVAQLGGFFSVFALTLASVGLYGLLSYGVVQRTREIGVRMALGARGRDVVRMIVGQGVRLALGGVVLGVAAALALTRWVTNLLYNVAPNDPATFAGVALLLLTVATLAAWLPARRAAKVDPMTALRAE